MRNSMVYLMTAILFVASTGFTLFSHTCFMVGETKVSTKKIDSCCSYETDSPKTVISDHCCENGSQFLKFEVAGSRFYDQELSITPINQLFIIDKIVTFSTNTLGLTYNDLPPPKTGRMILTEYQVFRI